jgi:hypothetical protein
VGFTAVDQLGLGFKQRLRFWLPGLSVGGIATPLSCLAVCRGQSRCLRGLFGRVPGRTILLLLFWHAAVGSTGQGLIGIELVVRW